MRCRRSAERLSKGCASVEGSRLPQLRGSVAYGNAALKKKAADLIHYRRALTEKAAAHTMQRL
jgi:hypothetical protein